MSTLLYRFDDPTLFPLLECETTAEGPVSVELDANTDHAFLRLAVRRQPEDGAEVTAVVGLPFVAVDGRPESLLLEIRGDASGCRVFAEAGDGGGRGYLYVFATVDFTGWRTCKVDVDKPTESWGDGESTAERLGRHPPTVEPPLQLYRLGVALPKSCHHVDIGLGALFVEGEVRLASPGIAG